ncbi:MAG TPA: hypothetical protein ENI87_08180 [bacterium]|nr:hypothetical protein [bacterium]
MVRCVDERRRNVTAPLVRAWSVHGLADLLVRALTRTGRAVPAWLRLLAENVDVPARHVESAIFGMS